MTNPQTQKKFPLDTLLVTGLWFVLCLLGLIAILVLNKGTFTYTLDDPYIHLAVAEQIASGHYGINSTEFSAPCSSAIWHSCSRRSRGCQSANTFRSFST